MDWDKQIIDEWRELGFYYQRDDDLKQWWLIGSQSGISNFTNDLLYYSNEVPLKEVSEHIHLGPHQYLKIMTWHIPLISEHAIGGTLEDIGRLKTKIDKKLSSTNVGETFEIGADYAPDSEYIIRFFVMSDGFDPASIELNKIK
jgi:hypothetical protein